MRFPLYLAVSAAFLFPVILYAADPEPFPDFTFKRQKPPKSGAGKRITIQIEPKPEPKVVEKPKEDTAKVPQTGRYGWFWEKVSPAIEENSTERLRIALQSLTDASANNVVSAPRLQLFQKITQAEGKNILKSTVGTQVSPALVLAVIAIESGGRIDAASEKGAQGLMQLIPATAKRFGVSDSLSAEENIKGGVAYLDWLLDEFDGDVVLALAGYNAGENAVKKHEGVPPYTETRDYVPKVLAAFQVARGMCKTQPQLVTDACALNLLLN